MNKTKSTPKKYEYILYFFDQDPELPDFMAVQSDRELAPVELAQAFGRWKGDADLVLLPELPTLKRPAWEDPLDDHVVVVK